MIEVEGLPEGWKAVGMLVDPDQYNKYVGDDGFLYWEAKIKLEKIQPRRIVLEEISKEEYHRLFNDERCSDIYNMRGSYWHEVKKTDIPLNNNDLKLSLSVDECRNVRSLIKDFENLGWFVNPARSLLLQKITKFIKENS